MDLAVVDRRRRVDEALLAELAGFTGRGLDHYRRAVAAGAGPFADDGRFGAARTSARPGAPG